jgi:hypothetical protein
MRSVLFGAFGLLFAGPAFALAVCDSHQKCDCDVSGGWTILHDNGAKATLSVAQREQGFLEGAHIKEGSNSGNLFGGRASGRHVVFTIHWSNKHEGRYEGKVGLDGRITGTNFDTTVNPAPTQHWHTVEAFSCFPAR